MNGNRDLVAPFDPLGRDDVATAGGTGANLGELTRAGLPAPPGLPTPHRRGSQQARFVAGLLGEMYPIRPYPLDVSSYTSVLTVAIANCMFAPLGLHYPSPEQMFVEEDGVVVRIEDAGPRPTWRMLYRPWLTLWRNRRYDLDRWQEDPILAEATQRAGALRSRDLAALSWADLLGTLREALDVETFVATLRRRYLPQAFRDMLTLWLLLACAGQRRRFGALQSGVETKTLAMNRALEALAAQVRANAELRDLFAATPAQDLMPALEARPAARAFLAAFRAFLDGYGHRETVLLLASQPAWCNAPAVPLGVVKGLAVGKPPTPSSGNGDDGSGQIEGKRSWQVVRDDLLERSILGKGPLRNLFIRALEGARRFPQLREDTHFAMTLGLPVVHAVFLELGRRLRQAGALEAPEDVLHLKLAEVEAAGRPWPPSAEAAARVRALATRRKAKRASLAGRPLLGEAAPPEAKGGSFLAGVPGSAGVAEGPVRIVSGPSEFGTLRHGDVLVAPFTNPAWTPLFGLAAAVVADTGGPLSHAAIVAREYGVPAVMGTVDATRRLRNGQRVRVDGTRGLVFLTSG